MVAAKRPSESFLGRYIIALERMLLLWDKPLVAMILAGIIFTCISATAGSPWRLSTAPYYNLLADAFLHGQLHLRIIPANTIDLSLFHGQYYLYWGPLPAILAIPLVALFGVNFSDVLQTLVYSAVTVGVLTITLKAANRQGVIRLSPTQRAILVLFFTLGTAYAPITEHGHVWQMAQVESILFIFLAYLVVFTLKNGQAFFFSGCAVAGILSTRNSAVLSAVFLVWYLFTRHQHLEKRRLFMYCLLGLFPVATTLILLGLYNYARFGNPIDMGINYHLMSPFFVSDFSKYGVFNVHFIPENIYYTYLYYPYSIYSPHFSLRCGSLFLLSPLFFCAIYAVWKFRKKTITWILLLTIILANIPLLMLMGPGSGLLGPRYTLDFVMPLLLLTAMGMEHLHNKVSILLMAISIVQYLGGTLLYVHAVP
jgi:hypothetical protein